MSSAEFYIVYINRSEGVSYEDVKEKMDLSRDWYRITERLWVLYTTSDAAKWHGRLRSLVEDGGNLFICRLDVSDRQGWMNNAFWKWLRERS